MTLNKHDFTSDRDNSTQVDKETTCIDDNSSIILEFFSSNDEYLECKEGTHYILVGLKHYDDLTSNSNKDIFNCPIKETLQYVPNQEGLKLDSRGRLHGNSNDGHDVYIDHTLGTYCVLKVNQEVGYICKV